MSEHRYELAKSQTDWTTRLAQYRQIIQNGTKNLREIPLPWIVTITITLTTEVVRKLNKKRRYNGVWFI